MKRENLVGKPMQEKIISILEETPGKDLSSRELAKIIFDRDKDLVKRRRKTGDYIRNDAEIITQIVGEVSSYRKKLESVPSVKIRRAEDNSLIFRFITKSKSSSSSSEGKATKNDKPSEEELYEKLRIYLRSTDIYSIRVDEKASANNRSPKGNHWLHPDIVGIEVLDKDWSRAVKDCVKACHGIKVRLWSFEVKKDMTKLREYYQQAVSNSSWANFGYLVAPEIKPKDREELNILFSLHGIGFIELNIEEPKKSQIIIPAKERPEIDWNMVNRIAKQNKPFEEHYVERIQTIHDTTARINWNSNPWKLAVHLFPGDIGRILKNIRHRK